MTVNTILRVDTGTSVSSRTTSSRLVYIPMAVLYGQMYIIRLEYGRKRSSVVAWAGFGPKGQITQRWCPSIHLY